MTSRSVALALVAVLAIAALIAALSTPLGGPRTLTAQGTTHLTNLTITGGLVSTGNITLGQWDTDSFVCANNTWIQTAAANN